MAPVRTLAVLALAFAAGCTSESSGTSAAASSIGRIENVGPKEFKALAEQKGGLFLDVRTPGEVARGHLPGASVIDINDSRFLEKVRLMPKDRPVFVYCASGSRSVAAADMMVRVGFPVVYNLVGGIGGWANAGLPLERPAGQQAAAQEGMRPDLFDLTLAAEERVLVDFRAEWCAPCRRMEPVVNAVAEAWKGKVKVLKVDVDLSEALADREKITGVPVLVYYVDGKERWRRNGEMSRAAIDAELARP